MQNETFCFIDDIRQKKTAATGAHHKVLKTGCKLPFEYKSRKELKKLMENPVLSTNPMPYAQFKKLTVEEQQRQLDMWGERYGKSSEIFSLLVNLPRSTANLALRKSGLDFKGEKGKNTKAHSVNLKQLKTLCDTFCGRAGIEIKTPEIVEPVEEPAEEVVEKIVLPAEENACDERLANHSRLNFTIEGTFTSDEMEVLLRSLRNASQIDPDGSYKVSIKFTEA